MTSVDDNVLTPLGPGDPREVSGYPLLAKVGEGGMGAVYLSRTRGNQPVALKIIRGEYAQNADFRARFEREVQAARRVSGYHIVPVLDHDMQGDQPWIATSYVPGLPLDDALTYFGPLPLSATFQLIGCTAQALASVHAASVIHRDLKPGNILLSSDGPWVIDFGIARATDTTQLTQTGGFIGTPQYMSPEHALGREVTGATDIFALGLIAAVVATGRHPYGEGAGLSIAATIANTDQRPPDLSGYPDALRELLTDCLHADPAARPGPAALADWCEQASGRQRRDFDGWLPGPLATEIARREAAAQRPPEPGPAPSAGAPTAAPGTGAGAPAPQSAADQPAPQPTADQPAGYAPTQASAGAPSGPHAPAYAATQAPAPPQPPGQGAPAAGRGPNRKPLVIGGVVAAALVAAGALWTLIPGGGGTEDGASGNGGASSAPSAGNEAPAQGGFRQMFTGKPVTLGYPDALAGFGNADLDAPKQDKDAPQGRKVSQTDREITMWKSEMLFATKTGKSHGPTAQECAAAPKKRALPDNMQVGELQGAKSIGKGSRLCTVTSKGNLAQLKITEVNRPAPPKSGERARLPEFKGMVTLWKPVR